MQSDESSEVFDGSTKYYTTYKSPTEKPIDYRKCSSIEEDTYEIKKGQTCKLYTKEYQSKEPNIWSSSNNAVATVSDNGIVTAVGDGTAVITLNVKGYTDTCTIMVYSDPGIVIKRMSLSYHETQQIDYDKSVNVVFKSSDTNIVTVDNEGKVYGVSQGYADVIARCSGKEYIINITVKLDGSDFKYTQRMDLLLGEKRLFEVTPSNDDIFKDFSLGISTDDDTVASIDENGYVYAVGKGFTIVHFHVGTMKLPCWVYVRELTVPDEMDMTVGETEKNLLFSGTFEESERVKMVSDNPAVALVDHDKSYYTVKAVGVGCATINIDTETIHKSFKVYSHVGVIETLRSGNLSGYNEADRAVLSKILAVISSQTNAGMSVSQKVKAIHDYLVVNNEYDYDRLNNNTLPKSSRSYVGVFMYGKSVCMGYAQAFMICMKVLDIPCKMICGDAGGSHSWNKVYIDGTWYYIDVT